MPTNEKTFLVQLKGGLDTVSDRVSLFQQPGKAVKMVNFEGGIRGGYRRISGYAKYSALTPDGVGSVPVIAARGYFDGCVAVQGGDVFFSQDGTSWIQVNKDTSSSFVDAATLSGLTAITRNFDSSEQYRFVEYHNGTEEELFFVDTLGTNPIARLVIRDNAGTTEYKYEHLEGTSWGAGNVRYPTTVEIHNERLVVAGDPSFKNELYYSDVLDPMDFIGGGLINIADEVVWTKTFRENLVVFGRSSIRAVAGLGDPSQQNIEAITTRIGCIAGASVQELAGGLVFLAPDGLRTVAATQRIDDFELGTLTTTIQDQILNIVEDINSVTISSTVVRSRNQYRLFSFRAGATASGIGGVVRGSSETGQTALEWNEFYNYPAYDLQGTRDGNNKETIFQVNHDSFVYLHDTGDTFDGTSIRAYFQTPRMVMDDPNHRKTMRVVEVYSDIEGPTNYSFKILYDEDLQNAASPGVYSLDTGNDFGIYDISEYGSVTSIYDSGNVRVNRVDVQGSGRFISIVFQSIGDSAPFNIQSLNIVYTLNGRF